MSGSGTTLIAAEMAGRVCHAVELSPAYGDVAVLRWQVFTARQAVLQGNNTMFADITTERAVEVAVEA